MSLLRELMLAKGMAASGGGGGGGDNPNSVEEIEGTLANPFGNMTQDEYDAFWEACGMGNANANLTVDILGQGTMVNLFADSEQGTPTFEYVYLNESESTINAMYVQYGGSVPVTLNEATRTTDGTHFTSYKTDASDSPTTLTIIWHPLPESPGV